MGIVKNILKGVKPILMFALLPKVLHNSVIFSLHVDDMYRGYL